MAGETMSEVTCNVSSGKLNPAMPISAGWTSEMIGGL